MEKIVIGTVSAHIVSKGQILYVDGGILGCIVNLYIIKRDKNSYRQKNILIQ